jgi:hypothetical protein
MRPEQYRARHQRFAVVFAGEDVDDENGDASWAYAMHDVDATATARSSVVFMISSQYDGLRCASDVMLIAKVRLGRIPEKYTHTQDSGSRGIKSKSSKGRG